MDVDWFIVSEIAVVGLVAFCIGGAILSTFFRH